MRCSGPSGEPRYLLTDVTKLIRKGRRPYDLTDGPERLIEPGATVLFTRTDRPGRRELAIAAPAGIGEIARADPDATAMFRELRYKFRMKYIGCHSLRENVAASKVGELADAATHRLGELPGIRRDDNSATSTNT